jgi:hypothetical protein
MVNVRCGEFGFSREIDHKKNCQRPAANTSAVSE